MKRSIDTIAGLALATSIVLSAACVQRVAVVNGKGMGTKFVSPAVPRILLHGSRQAESDLEVTGMVDGLAPRAIGYVQLEELSALPQMTIVVRNDENFPDVPDGTRVTGVSLEELARGLGVLPSSDLMDAWCVDKYRTHYPADYIAAHSPVLGLKVEGQDPERWAEQRHRRSTGRYFITHADFKPAFTVLKHADEPQVPTGVVRIDYGKAAATYGAIAPRTRTASKDVDDGFVIARQNCLRCHNQGEYGGRKAGVEWPVLRMLALQQTLFFEKYVRDPKSVSPGARMPGNPKYDDATLAALVEYFKVADDEAKEGSGEHE